MMGDQRMMVGARRLRSSPRSLRLRAPGRQEEERRPERVGGQTEQLLRPTPRTPASAKRRGWVLGPAAVLALQRTHGNAHVQRLLAVQRCGATPCDCSPEERAAEAGQQSARPPGPLMLQRMWPFDDDEDSAGASTGGEEKSWVEQATDTVSDWLAPGDDEAAALGPEQVDWMNPPAAGGEKAPGVAGQLVDWMNPPAADDETAAPGPGQVDWMNPPAAEGAEGMPGPVAEPEEESGFIEDIFDWLGPAAAGGEQAAGAAGEAAGGAWDAILAEIQKKTNEQAVLKCRVKAGKQYQWCVMENIPRVCKKEARVPGTGILGSPKVDGTKYRECIGTHGVGCWDYARSVCQGCYASNGLDAAPGVILPNV